LSALAPAVVLDFDGTICERDIGDEIADRFGPPGWRDLDRRVAAGEMTLLDMQRRVWPQVRGAREEVLAFVDEVARFRPGFEALVGVAAARGAPLVVASGGFDFYIERVLARLGPLRAAIEVVSNRAVFGRGGIEVDFPHRGRGCGRCAVCKGAVVEGFRAAGRRTIFCGDGGSDGCAAGRADLLFAVEGSPLARQCEARGVPHRTFASFEEVAREI
jgi:2,3-diketo-5-methylthio-1-phosphopentane phosphatase